jgi:stage V sporulation protein R
MKQNKLLYENNVWTVEILSKMWDVIDNIGSKELGLDYYAPQIELITYDQMLDAYSSVGMPIMYNHWSFGKSFIMNHRRYKAGEMGLAYEMVINSDPAVCYCLETNSATMQALVLAHAACGHVHFFKNNYMFKDWTDASGILTYLKYAKNYIDYCSTTYGDDIVEKLLDACHSLQDYGIDTYKRGKKKSQQDILDREITRLKFKEETYSKELESIPGFSKIAEEKKNAEFWASFHNRLKKNKPEQYTPPRPFPEENLLYYFEKRSPVLFNWEKEIVRIVRIIAQYFYPQRLTKVMNEGFATAIHYTIMNTLYDRGYITEGNILEFLHSHTGVCCQPPLSSINPYALGFNIFMDLKRMCLDPTEEDKKWYPDIAGSQDWLALWKDCVANYRDESFILQFLSPKVIRDMKLFNIFFTDENDEFYTVTSTHNDEDVHEIRLKLSKQHSLDYYRPNIQIIEMNWEDNTLHLLSKTGDRYIKDDDEEELRAYLMRLWGYDVLLHHE